MWGRAASTGYLHKTLCSRHLEPMRVLTRGMRRRAKRALARADGPEIHDHPGRDPVVDGVREGVDPRTQRRPVHVQPLIRRFFHEIPDGEKI